MTLTGYRTVQYIGIFLALGLIAAGYWYFRAQAGVTLNQSQTDVMTSNLVGLWSFNADDISGTTIYDRSTSVVNGTAQSNVTEVVGKVGQALSFNGTTDYISIGSAAPSFIQETETSWATLTSPAVSASFDVLAGDVLVVYMVSENNAGGANITAISGGSLTWTFQEDSNVNGNTENHIATATVDSDKSMTVSVTCAVCVTNTIRYGFNVLTFRGSDGIGDSTSVSNTAGAPTLNITTTATSSAVVVVNGDWNAVDGASRTWRTNAGALTEQTYSYIASQYTVYGGYHANVGAIGTYAVGLSAPTGQQYTTQAIEVKGTSGTAINGVKTVSFWAKPTSTTQSIIDMNGTANVAISAGTVQGNNFTSPTIYVDGVATSTFPDTEWHHVTVTTGTGINAEAVFGKVSSTYYSGYLDEVRFYTEALSAAQVEDLYSRSSEINSDKANTNTNGLIGLWTFDGADISGTTATDRSSSGNNGTLTNTPTKGIGKVGQALSFTGNNSGTNQYVNASTALTSSNNLTSVSMCVWIKPSAPPGAYAQLVTKGGVGGNYWDLYLIDNNPGGSLGFGTSSNGPNYVEVTDEYLPIGVWSHLCGVQSGADSATYYLYFNGRLVNSSLYNSGGAIARPSDTGEPIRIGSYDASTNQYVGLIDDVRIYNRALSASDVESIYAMTSGTDVNTSASQSGGLGRLETGLIGYLTLDEGTGTTAVDYSVSGNGSGGTLTNGPTWTTGMLGGAVDFDGTDDYITIPDNSRFDFGANANFSLSGWFYRDTFTTDDTIIAKRSGLTAAENGYIVYIDDATDQLIFEVSDAVDEYSLTSDTTFTSVGWNHFSIIWDDGDATGIEIYINGSEGRATHSGTLANIGTLANALTLRMGAESDDGNPFDGKLDDLRLYDRHITVEDASLLYRQTTTSGLEAGIMGYWSFDGADTVGTSAYDRSGAQNRGVLTNGPVRIIGKLGQGLDLDGTNDGVVVSDVGEFDFTDTETGVIAGWFNRDTFTTDDTVIAKRSGIVNTDTGWIIYIDDATDQLIFEISDATDEYSVTSTSTFTSVGWNHFAIVWDEASAANTEIYINGVADSGTDSGTISNIGNTSNALDVIMGAESDAGNPFDGKIDEMRFYDRVLTAAEIAALYKQAQ